MNFMCSQSFHHILVMRQSNLKIYKLFSLDQRNHTTVCGESVFSPRMGEIGQLHFPKILRPVNLSWRQKEMPEVQRQIGSRGR